MPDSSLPPLGGGGYWSPWGGRLLVPLGGAATGPRMGGGYWSPYGGRLLVPCWGAATGPLMGAATGPLGAGAATGPLGGGSYWSPWGERLLVPWGGGGYWAPGGGGTYRKRSDRTRWPRGGEAALPCWRKSLPESRFEARPSRCPAWRTPPSRDRGRGLSARPCSAYLRDGRNPL